MVQTYGVAPVNDTEPTDQVRGESSALLGDDATIKRASKADGHATIVSCVSNLANTIIGSGEFLTLIFNPPVSADVGKGMLTFPLVSWSPIQVYSCRLPCCPIGHGISGYTPRDCYLRVFWLRSGIWLIPPVPMRNENTTSTSVVLRYRATHIPSRSRFL